MPAADYSVPASDTPDPELMRMRALALARARRARAEAGGGAPAVPAPKPGMFEKMGTPSFLDTIIYGFGSGETDPMHLSRAALLTAGGDTARQRSVRSWR
jgi:hypothetical protein